VRGRLPNSYAKIVHCVTDSASSNSFRISAANAFGSLPPIAATRPVARRTSSCPLRFGRSRRHVRMMQGEGRVFRRL